MPHTVAIVVGSLRKESFNRKIAKALIGLAPPSLKMEIVEISDLTLFNQDIEANPPASWTAFREKIKAADAVLFITPEYNRSVPGVLKNAIDVGSRPYGQNAFDRKPAAVISGSLGAIGGFGANHHLRQTLAYLNMVVMGQPEAYLGSLGDCFDAAGNICNVKTEDLLKKFAGAFATWIDQHAEK